MWVERLNSNQAHMDTHLYGRCSYGNKMLETSMDKPWLHLFLFISLFLIGIKKKLKVKWPEMVVVVDVAWEKRERWGKNLKKDK